MHNLLKRELKFSFCIYVSVLILITFQAGLKIWRVFIAFPACEGQFLYKFLNFPSLLFFVLLLYFWPIHFGQNLPALNNNTNHVNQRKKNLWNDLAIAIIGLILLFVILMPAFAPELYNIYRIVLITLVLLVLPFHIFTNLNIRKDYGLLVVLFTGGLSLFTLFLLLPFLIHHIWKLSLFLLIVALVIWSAYILSFLPSNQPGLIIKINQYNPFKHPSLPQPKITLPLLGLNALASLVFLGSAYLSVPRIETFNIYRPAFNQVVAMVKNNQLEQEPLRQSKIKRMKIPCKYNFLTTYKALNVIQENHNLTINFRIFSIGFGDGHAGFVYRTKPIDYTKNEPLVQSKPLGGSWYWEVWIWN